MGADLKRNARRTVRTGGLPVVLLAAAFALAGCGGSTGTDASGLEAENKGASPGERAARRRGREAAGRGGAPPGRGRGRARDVGDGGADDGADRAGRGGAGGGLAVAGPGDVSGEELPEAMPEDFPIPAGAVVDYVSEMGYDFSLNFVIDSGFETTAETSWERGTFIPEGSPNDPAFEQTKETMTVEVFWTDFGLLNKNG